MQHKISSYCILSFKLGYKILFRTVGNKNSKNVPILIDENERYFLQPVCSSLWWMRGNPYTLVQEGKKCYPYVCSQYELCGGGLVNMTGTNLKGILEIMKFAFHYAAPSDFMRLQDKIVEANLTYSKSNFSLSPMELVNN